MNKNNNTINLLQKNENGTDLSLSNMSGVGITKELFSVLTKDIYADSYKKDIDNREVEMTRCLDKCGKKWKTK